MGVAHVDHVHGTIVRKALIVTLLSLGALGFLATRPALRLRAQSTAPRDAVESSARQILLRYGIKDNATRTWHGWIEGVSGDAKVLGLAGYHFSNEDQVTVSDSGAQEFSFTTRAWTPSVQQVDLTPVLPGPRAVFPNGVYAVVTGGPAARFHVLGADNFTFSLGDLEGGKQLTFENGNVEVEAVAQPFAASTAGEADFPALAMGPAGRGAVVWQEFGGEHDRLATREWDGAKWNETEIFDAPESRDVFRPSAAYDGAGVLHLIWAAQVNGNWDLYERRKTASGWSSVERLTTADGTDFHQRVTADGQGNLWLAWQAFRDGQSDIFLKSYRGGAWGAEMRVSESAANDWEPAVAADPSGNVWIAWDSYDRGNYDILVRSFANGQAGPIRAITHSPRLEAHASIACDKGRLWIAFDEAEANWGKDYGYLVKTAGNPLYQSRKVRSFASPAIVSKSRKHLSRKPSRYTCRASCRIPSLPLPRTAKSP